MDREIIDRYRKLESETYERWLKLGSKVMKSPADESEYYNAEDRWHYAVNLLAEQLEKQLSFYQR